jgi:hypothetical protein
MCTMDERMIVCEIGRRVGSPVIREDRMICFRCQGHERTRPAFRNKELVDANSMTSLIVFAIGSTFRFG